MTKSADPGERVWGPTVPEFKVEFQYYNGDWQRIFDRQISLIRQDIARARAEDRWDPLESTCRHASLSIL